MDVPSIGSSGLPPPAKALRTLATRGRRLPNRTRPCHNGGVPQPRTDPPISTPRTTRFVSGAPPSRRAALLDRYAGWRAAVEGGGVDDRVAWIAPTPAAAATIRSQLATRHHGAWLHPGVSTLRQAARTLVQSASEPVLFLGPAAKRRLLAELATTADRKEVLGPLDPLLGSPGLIDFLAARFRSLRLQGVGPAEAGSALRRTEGEEAGGVIAGLFRDYLAALDKFALADDEEVLIRAAALASRATTPCRLILDLPGGVAAIEERFAAALAAEAVEVVVATPGRAALAQRLPAVSRAEARWLAAMDATPGPPSEAPDAEGVAAGLLSVRRRLFDDDLSDQPAAPTDGLHIVAGGPGQDTPRRVAAAVKRLLLAGVKAESVVVATPHPDSAAPRYAEAFAEYGVPTWVDTTEPLASAGLVGLLLDLLSLADADWSFETLLAVVSRADLPVFARRSGGGFATVGAAAEWFVRELQVPSGRRYMQRQAEQIATLDGSTPGSRRLATAAQAAADAFAPLGEACEALPTEATPLGWLDALDTALAKLGHAGLAGLELPAGRRASDTLEEAAASLESLARWRDRTPRPLSRRAFLELLRDWATRLRLPNSDPSEGRVRIVATSTAIGLPCEHLFVVDAGESAFAAGVTASDPESAEDAMLLFHELASTPSRGLTFAYAALDESAQPLAASPFVADVERLFPVVSLLTDTRPLLDRIDADAEPLCPREWRLRAATRAKEGDGADLASYTAARGTALSHAIRVIDTRSGGDDFGVWEGVFDGAAARTALLERYGPDHLWSASQLELMATCPYKFFARQVLRMEPVGELALGVDYRRRGSLMHDALAHCLTNVAAELRLKGGKLSDLAQEDLAERLVEEIDLLNHAGKLPPHEAALAAIEARQATDWAARYAEQQAKFDGQKRWSTLDHPLTPTLMEARFGPAKGDDGVEDHHSTDEPLELTLPAGEVLRVTGRIDRIDTGRVGDRTMFTVIDYKTSKEYTAKRSDIEAGKQLQPVLYALAAQRLLLEEDAIPVGAGYWAVRKNGFVAPAEKDLPMVVYEDGCPRASDEWLAVVEAVRQRCEGLVGAVRLGQFPMHNDDEHCGRSCEFRTVCRVGQARSRGKIPPAPPAPHAEGIE